jgi:hypothetical protein
MSKTFIVDITKFKEAQGKHAVSCDACGKVLGEHYPTAKGCMGVTLPKNYNGEADASEDVIYADKDSSSKQHHFCQESCLFDHLKNRKDKFEANRAKEMNQ